MNLILGLGNRLMTDDAFGGRVVEELQNRYLWPEEVQLIDGGTLGLDLLPYLEEADRLVIVDALNMGAKPGAVFRLSGDAVPRAFAGKLSVHQMGLQDLLAVAELQGHLPAEVVVWGVQYGSIEPGLELSRPVATALSRVLDGVISELTAWGSAPVPAQNQPDQFERGWGCWAVS